MGFRERFAKIYEYRPFLKALVLKNLKGQYRNSYLGFLWQFLTPTIAVLLFYFLFTSLRQNEMDDYWVFLCAGMFPFTFLNTSISGGGNTFTGNAGMIKKIYVPREIFSLAKVTSSLITFAIAYVIIIVLATASGHDMDVFGLLWIVPLVVLSYIFVFGADLMLSSITVYVRDVGYLVTALSRIIFWGTPIFYSVNSLTGALADIIWLNPFTWFVTAFQDCVYGGTVPEMTTLAACLIMSIVVLIAGEAVFSKLNRGFAERL